MQSGYFLSELEGEERRAMLSHRGLTTGGAQQQAKLAADDAKSGFRKRRRTKTGQVASFAFFIEEQL